MRPIMDRVIIKQDAKTEQKTASGIILRTEAQASEKPRGTIIAIGPKVQDVQPGDIVLFNVNYHQKFKDAQGEEFVTVNEADILAILPPEADVMMEVVR